MSSWYRNELWRGPVGKRVLAESSVGEYDLATAMRDQTGWIAPTPLLVISRELEPGELSTEPNNGAHLADSTDSFPPNP